MEAEEEPIPDWRATLSRALEQKELNKTAPKARVKRSKRYLGGPAAATGGEPGADEWDDVEVPAFISPAFYPKPPAAPAPPLPPPRKKEKPRRHDNAHAGRPYRTPKPRRPRTPERGRLEAEERPEASPEPSPERSRRSGRSASPASTVRTLRERAPEEPFGCPAEVQRGYYAKAPGDAWVARDGLYRDWRRLVPRLAAEASLRDRNAADGDLAELGRTHATVQALDLAGNAALTHRGFELVPRLERCTALDVSGCAGFDDRCCEHLRRHTKYLRSLDASDTGIGDAGLRSLLAGLKLVHTLRLRRCPRVTDKGLVEISAAMKARQAVRVLDLRGSTGFGNDALLKLLAEGGIHLQELRLGGCRQVDSLALLGLRRDVGTLELRVLDLAHLPRVRSGTTLLGGFATGCRRLVELRLAGLHAAVDDAALEAFADRAGGSAHGHAPLEVVDLCRCHRVSAAGLRPFLAAVAGTLRRLDVSYCPLLDDAFGAALAPCLQLDAVVMVDTPLLSDRGLAAWAPPPELDAYGKPKPRPLERTGGPRARLKLRELTMAAALTGSVDTSSRCRVPRYAAAGIRALLKRCGGFLLKLDLDGAPRVDDAAALAVGDRCPNLEKLGFDGLSKVTDDGLERVAAGCPRLRRLRAAGCGGDRRPLTDRTARALGAHCRELRTLDLSRSSVAEGGLAALAAGCRSLETLKLSNCDDVCDAGVEALFRGCGRLRVLVVASCDLITEKCLRHVGACAELRGLDAHRCAKGRGLDDKHLRRAARRLPFAKVDQSERNGLVAVDACVETFVRHQRVARRAYHLARLAQAHVRRRQAKAVVKARRARVKREKAMVAACVVAQRLARRRRAILIRRQRALDRDREEAQRAAEDAAIRLEELREAREQRARDRARASTCVARAYASRKRANAFGRLRRHAEWERYRRELACLVQDRVRHFLVLRRNARRELAARGIQGLARIILGRFTLERRRKEALIKAAKRKAQERIDQLEREMKARKRAEELARRRKEKELAQGQRKSQLADAFAAARKDETPFEKKKREEREAARRIQRRGRHYARAMLEWRNGAARKVQGCGRAYLARDMVRRAKRRIRRIMAAFERFGHPNTVLNLTEMRAERAAVLAEEAAAAIMARAQAMALIQRSLKARLKRNRSAKYWLQHREHRYATQIQTRFRARATKRAVVAMNRAYNRAAFKLAHLFARRRARAQYRAIRKELEARANEDAQAHKAELMRRKNDRIVEKCFAAGRLRGAVKIQTTWRERRVLARERCIRVAAREAALRNARLEFAMHLKAKEAKALAARALYHGRLWAMRAVKKASGAAANAAKAAFNATVGTSEEDQIRRGYDLPEVKKEPPHKRALDYLMYGRSEQRRREAAEQVENSILNLQSRSIQPRGVVDLMITCGKQELASESEQQDYNKAVNQPVFERCKKDLSSNKSKVYVWYCMGSGPRVLTKLKVVRAPPNHKNKAANESRIFGAFVSGTIIRGHDSLGVEIHGDAGIFRGESAPPIDAVNFARNEKEEASYKKLDWEQVDPDMSCCGDKLGPFRLVVHRKKFHKKVVLNVLALGLLKQEKWYTGEQRLKDMIAIHALPIDAVIKLRETFDKLNYGGNDRIETRDWLESVREPKEPVPMYMKWLLEMIEVESLSGSHLTFGEYVCAVATLCMFDMVGLLRWLFKYRTDDVNKLYADYASGNGEIYFEDWVKIAERLPMLLFALLRFQAAVMKVNLGEKFWFQKKMDFDEQREKLGVERASMMA